MNRSANLFDEGLICSCFIGFGDSCCSGLGSSCFSGLGSSRCFVSKGSYVSRSGSSPPATAGASSAGFLSSAAAGSRASVEVRLDSTFSITLLLFSGTGAFALPRRFLWKERASGVISRRDLSGAGTLRVLLDRPSCFLIESASGTADGALDIFGAAGFSVAALFISSFLFCKLSFSSSRLSDFCGPALRDRPALPRRILFFSSSGATYFSVCAFLSFPNRALNSGSSCDCAPIVPLLDLRPERKSVFGVVSCFSSGDCISEDLSSGDLRAGNLDDDEEAGDLRESDDCGLGDKAGVVDNARDLRGAGFVGFDSCVSTGAFSSTGSSFGRGSFTGSAFSGSEASGSFLVELRIGVEDSAAEDLAIRDAGLALVGGVTFLEEEGEWAGVFLNKDDRFSRFCPMSGGS